MEIFKMYAIYVIKRIIFNKDIKKDNSVNIVIKFSKKIMIMQMQMEKTGLAVMVVIDGYILIAKLNKIINF